MTLTQVLEYSNLFFTGLFFAEMAMKIIAEGPFGYIRSVYNLFDGFIVILRYDVYYVPWSPSLITLTSSYLLSLEI